MLYKVLIHCNSHLKQMYLSNKTEKSTLTIKMGVVYVYVHEHTYIKAFKRRAGLAYR